MSRLHHHHHDQHRTLVKELAWHSREMNAALTTAVGAAHAPTVAAGGGGGGGCRDTFDFV